MALPGWADGGSRDTYSFGHGLAEMLHPVCHLSLAVGTQLQAGPVSQNDLEGVGPVCGVGSPAATALFPPGPEEEGEMVGEEAGVGDPGAGWGVQTPGLGLWV